MDYEIVFQREATFTRPATSLMNSAVPVMAFRVDGPVSEFKRSSSSGSRRGTTAVARYLAPRSTTSQRRARKDLTNPSDVSVHLYVRKKLTLLLGYGDGTLWCWKPKYDSLLDAAAAVLHKRTSLFGSVYLPDVHSVSLQAHHGAISAMTSLRYHQHFLLATGGCDGMVKLWLPWGQDDSCFEPGGTHLQKLVGHSGSITSLAVAGHVLTSSSTDGTVCVWRPDHNRALMLYPWFSLAQKITFDAWPTALGVTISQPVKVFAGDDRGSVHEFRVPILAEPLSVPTATATLVTTDSSESSASTGPQMHNTLALERTTQLHKLGVSMVLVVEEEKYVVTTSFDSTVQVYTTSGTGVMACENPNKCRYTGMVWKERFSAAYTERSSLTEVDTGLLYLVDCTGHLQLWNVNAGKCLKNQQISPHPIASITLGYGPRVVTSSGGGVQVWRVKGQRALRRLAGHTGPVITLQHVQPSDGGLVPSVGQHLQGDGRVYSGSVDNSLRSWDTSSSSAMCTSQMQIHGAEMSSSLYVGDPEVSNLFYTGHTDGSVAVWNIDSGSRLHRTSKGHRNTVSCLSCCRLPEASTAYLISGSFDGTVGVWNVSSRMSTKPRQELSFRVSNAEILAVQGHRHKVWAGGNDGVISLWSIKRGDRVRAFKKVHTEAITALELDGRLLISGSDDGTICVWERSLGYVVRRFSLDGCDHIRAITLLPTLGLFGSCSRNGVVNLLDYTSREGVVYTFPGVSESPRCLLYDVHQNQILVGSDTGHIHCLVVPKDDLMLKQQLEQEADETAAAAVENTKSGRRQGDRTVELSKPKSAE